MSKKLIAQLEDQAATLRDALVAVNKQLSDLHDAKVLPALRKKYEGKWFKKEYPDDGSTTYYKVLEINSRDSCVAFRFSVWGDSVTIGIEEWTYLSLLGKSITEREFYRAFDSVRDMIAEWQLK